MVFNSFGPRNAFFEAAVQDAAPVLQWVQAQSQRDALSPTGFGAVIHAAVDTGEITADGSGGAGALAADRGRGYDGQRDRRGGVLPGAVSGGVRTVAADPSLARAAFEEAVRLESPVQTFFRTTTRDVTIGGETIQEGSKVLMFLGAANRDPRRWERPDDYDITRRNAGHVGFGTGIHGCVGAALARLEGNWYWGHWRGRWLRSRSWASRSGATTTRCAGWRACRCG